MFGLLRHVRSSKRTAFLIALVAVSACTLATDVSGPAAMIKFNGDQQMAPANTALTSPLTVIVVDQFGQPLQSITVRWVIASGGGALGASAAVTDEGGLASVTYTTGPTAGQAVIEARVSGLLPLSFSITIT
jgi:hypothetical protein